VTTTMFVELLRVLNASIGVQARRWKQQAPRIHW